jgi:cob(I)alamin adenosyltransferase
MKIYTKKGDKGTTTLCEINNRIPKNDPHVHILGELDELNCHIGYLNSIWEDNANPYLGKLQNIIFDIGASFAFQTKNTYKVDEFLEAEIVYLETEIDRMTNEIPKLSAFVIPGGDPVTAYIHVVRAACRRAERSLSELCTSENALSFINRLSDYFFTLARYNTKKEVIYVNWKKRETCTGA